MRNDHNSSVINRLSFFGVIAYSYILYLGYFHKIMLMSIVLSGPFIFLGIVTHNFLYSETFTHLIIDLLGKDFLKLVILLFYFISSIFMGIASFNFQSAVVLYYRKNKCLDGLSLRFSEVIETYKRIGSIIVLQILLLYLYFVGIAFFVLPGLIFMSMYSLAMPIMVYDNIGIRSAIKGSGAMTKGYRLKIFLLLLTISILVIIPTYFLRIIGNSISEKIVGSSSDMIISLIVGIITTPFISLAIALIFLELKTNNQLVEQATGLTAE